MVLYTISHDGVTIRAHCQAWDIKNNCKLEVGKDYDLKRERGGAGFDTLCLYEPNDKSETPHVQTVLAVEEEKVER